MSTVDRDTPQRSLPILEVVSQAYRILLSQPGAWLTAALIPLAIEVAVQVGYLSLYGPDLVRAMMQQGALPAGMQIRGLGVQVCVLIAYALFAVSWHRFNLLGPEERPRLLPPILGRHMRFFGMTLGLSLLIGLAVAGPLILLMVGQIDSVIAIVGVAVLAVALFVRWQLIFPAIALDQRLSLGQSWIATRGFGLKLFWGLVLAALPWVLVSALLDSLTQVPQAQFLMTGQLNLVAFLALLAGGLLGYGLVGVIVGTVSGAYRHLVLEAGRP